MTHFPPVIQNSVGSGISRAGAFGRSEDPAKFIVDLRRIERPKLSVPGGPEFEWPLGIEGARFHGNATLAEHHYIGDNAVVVRVTHLDDRRIDMSGQFPGITGALNVNDLLGVIVAEAPDDAKLLYLPGINTYASRVAVDSYDFNHPEDDNNDSWDYTITFRYLGQSAKRVIRPPKITSPVNPTSKKRPPKGKSARIYTVKSGVRTLRAVANVVYRNPNRWRDIYDKNKKALQKIDTPFHQIPTKPLPLGMKLNY